MYICNELLIKKGEGVIIIKKKIFIVACNQGVATSQVVASKVQNLLEERGIHNVSVEAVDVISLDSYLESASAYIRIVPSNEEYDIPVVNGMAFLTGINQEDELSKLIKIALGD